MRNNSPYWILHKSVTRPDTYECSVCRGKSRIPLATCPYCGSKPRKVKSIPDYVDEMEILDIIGK